MKETFGSSRRMYIRRTADILQKCKDICNADITPNRNDMRNTAYINELYIIVISLLNQKFNIIILTIGICCVEM